MNLLTSSGTLPGRVSSQRRASAIRASGSGSPSAARCCTHASQLRKLGVVRDQVAQTLPRRDQAVMRELGVRLTIGRIRAENDQPRIGQAPQDIPFCGGNLGLEDTLAGNQVGAADRWCGPASAAPGREPRPRSR